MAFPTNPTDGQMHNGYTYNSVIDGWEYIEYVEMPTSGLISYDGKIVGSPKFCEGPNGEMNAFEFNGVDEHIDLGDLGNIGNEFTYSAWFKTTSNSGYNMIINVDGGSTGNPQLRTSDGRVQFRFYAGNSLTSSSKYNDNTWYLATGGINSNGDYFLYVDLQFIGTLSPDKNLNLSGNTRVGLYTSYDNYDGLISNFRIYNRVLTTDEIELLYKHGINKCFIRSN